MVKYLVFSSVIFVFVFLPILLGVYFLSRDSARNYVLLAFSILFYAWGEPKFLFVMLGIVLIDYLAGVALYVIRKKSEDKVVLEKIILLITIVSNLGVLCYYKYAGFLVENWIKLTDMKLKVPEIILPIGISFFTFQALSYVIDVYRREVQVQKNPFLVLLYVSLFPQLVAGPIVRYQTVENEMLTRKITINDVATGLERFIIGFAKKLIIANSMATITDEIYAGSVRSSELCWFAAITYMLQIYYDFSAYSDMAIGLGRIFGFHFEENFNYPYISKSITEFWRRWHISLSTWFRDYVYIPLGGNRKGNARLILNMFIVWMLTGFWHGASWNFILWGIYYFVFLAIEKLFLKRVLERIPNVFGHIYTIMIVLGGWVLFRAETLAECKVFLKNMAIIQFSSNGWDKILIYLSKYGMQFLLALIFCIPIYRIVREKLIEKHSSHLVIQALHYMLLLCIFFISVAHLVNTTYNPFIYFRF